MTQTEIVNKLNAIYPGLDLIETEDKFCSYDAENSKYIVEVKSRDKKYDNWIIERKKFDTNLIHSLKLNKMFVYLTEHKGKIMTWNINKLLDRLYDFKWTEEHMPYTSQFGDRHYVIKKVGYLYEKDAKVHE